MHWKKHWLALIFWLFIPLAATVGTITMTNTITSDSNIPVGVVMKDESKAASELLQEIKSTPFIDVHLLHENDALSELKKHQLDSVFVIRDGFEAELDHGGRNQLLTSYQSDLSFAYTPVREMILSYIQQETGRMKAARTVLELADSYTSSEKWTQDEIITKAKEVQSTEDLLHTSFSFGENPSASTDSVSMVNTWGIWCVFTLLSTLMLFDWVIHEKHASVTTRFAFVRYSFKHYLILNFCVYTVVCFIIDLITLSVFWGLFREHISIWNMIAFRLLLNMAAFLFANLFKHPFYYYTTAFALTLIFAIGSGAVIPVTGLTNKWPWMEMLNPLQPFLSGKAWNFSSWIILLLALLWYCRKEKYHASR
ncbi:ABC transporter permease [Lentibacillus sp. N15]